MTLQLLQMTTVLLTALVFGWIARKCGQVRVIGEIVGGIFLGPSAFGPIAPHASTSLFPQSSLGPFDVLSTVGLILFLFLIGVQLEYEHLRQHKTAATLTSALSILLPFLFAMAVAPSLRTRFAPSEIWSVSPSPYSSPYR
jgi:Kef-type K+ transport system membrane component KefB